MRNNMKKRNKLNSTNVIYQYNWPHEDCMLRNIKYTGSTTTALSRRLTMHLNITVQSVNTYSACIDVVWQGKISLIIQRCYADKMTPLG